MKFAEAMSHVRKHPEVRFTHRYGMEMSRAVPSEPDIQIRVSTPSSMMPDDGWEMVLPHLPGGLHWTRDMGDYRLAVWGENENEGCPVVGVDFVGHIHSADCPRKVMRVFLKALETLE